MLPPNKTSRIAFSRIGEKEAGTDSLPPPPDAGENSKCPFCRPRVTSEPTQLQPDLVPDGRMIQNHLLSTGGSLIHPHLQINADRVPGNHHRFLLQKANDFYIHYPTAGARFMGSVNEKIAPLPGVLSTQIRP